MVRHDQPSFYYGGGPDLAPARELVGLGQPKKQNLSGQYAEEGPGEPHALASQTVWERPDASLLPLVEEKQLPEPCDRQECYDEPECWNWREYSSHPAAELLEQR